MAYILIISLDTLFRAYIGAELMEMGHDVDGLDSVEEAVEELPKKVRPPSMIVIEAHGQSFDQASIKTLSKVSTVLVCAGPYDLAQEDFARLGVQHIARKPLSVGELVIQIVKLLDESPRQ